MIETDGDLAGRRLDPTAPFPFRCHPALACFNACCRDKRLTLLPYDVLRLARALRRPTDEVLASYGTLEIDPRSGWPALRIALAADGRCPFVGGRGCAVYEDRPTCCRIYPLARAVSLDAAGEPHDIILVETSPRGCLGFDGGDPATTVEAWAAGQGLAPYRAANDRMARLFLHPRRPLSLSSEQVHAVIMALYNLDVFRRAVARPDFGARFGLDDAVVARALSSDEALLDLGQDWLTVQLFG